MAWKQEEIDGFIEALKCGFSVAEAARFTNIAEKNVYKKMKRDPVFKARVEEAKLWLGHVGVMSVRAAAVGQGAKFDPVTGTMTKPPVPQDWRAGAWLAERGMPERFAPQQKVQVGGEIQKRLIIVAPDVDPE